MHRERIGAVSCHVLWTVAAADDYEGGVRHLAVVVAGVLRLELPPGVRRFAPLADGASNATTRVGASALSAPA
jgi:hypothetical protein